jgi:hypothetical protein
VQNLARVKDCDRTIRDELERARIDVVPMDGLDHEVPYSIGGGLGPFTFTRAWYYWVVRGPMPLSIAQTLYDHPKGRRTVRVTGHCGCPAPEEPWVTWYAPDGAQLWPRDKYEKESKQFSDSPTMKETMKAMLDRGEYRVSDDLLMDGSAYIMSYHIDEQAGLLLFSQAILEHGLDENAPLLAMMQRIDALRVRP